MDESDGEVIMADFSGAPVSDAYYQRVDANNQQSARNLQSLAQMMTLQRQQQEMAQAPEDRMLKRRLIESQIGAQDFKMDQSRIAQAKEAEKQALISEWSNLPADDPRKPILQQKLRVLIDPANALDPAKTSNLPWYVQRGLDGRTSIDPAYAEFEKMKSREGKAAAPFFQFLPTPEGYAVGNARSGQMSPATIDGRPVMRSQDSPELQQAISQGKKLGADTGEQQALLPIKKDALTSISEAKNMLNSGIYSGGWGPTQKNIAKYTPGMDKDKVERTEAFVSHIGNVVVPRLKEFGGNDSNEELKYLKGITGGDIALEPGALKVILDSAEAKMARNIKRLSAPVGVPKNRTATPNVLRFDAQGNPI